MEQNRLAWKIIKVTDIDTGLKVLVPVSNISTVSECIVGGEERSQIYLISGESFIAKESIEKLGIIL